MLLHCGTEDQLVFCHCLVDSPTVCPPGVSFGVWAHRPCTGSHPASTTRIHAATPGHKRPAQTL